MTAGEAYFNFDSWMGYQHYTGDVDEAGKACGFGIAKSVDEVQGTTLGTWLNNTLHGLGEFFTNFSLTLFA